MEREFDAYKLCCSMYPSIFNSFPVIRTTSAKHRRFHVPQPTFLPRDAMHKRGLCCHAVSVRLSVTFVDHVKTNKHIYEFFSPSGSDTILVFPSERGCRYSDGNPPNGDVECKRYDKMTIFSQISHSISETLIDRWAHAARQFVSIEFSFHPYNI